LRFLKQEGLPIMVYYTICMTLQVFVFQFHKGYFQTFFIILAPLGKELSPVANWILSFMFFVIGYQVISIVRRRNIRKEKYDFLFERHVAENQ
ncbi:MAG: hypothetical protein IKW18_02910, partial [Clostridia bacterium]|nr:hypothetical protein [Clostridia bacterium]